MTRNDRQSQQGWKAVLPMHEFLSAAFAKRLKWGRITEIGAQAEAEVLVAEADCEKCGVITDIIVGIDLKVADERVDVSLLDLTPYDSVSWSTLTRRSSTSTRLRQSEPSERRTHRTARRRRRRLRRS